MHKCSVQIPFCFKIASVLACCSRFTGFARNVFRRCSFKPYRGRINKPLWSKAREGTGGVSLLTRTLTLVLVIEGVFPQVPHCVCACTLHSTAQAMVGHYSICFPPLYWSLGISMPSWVLMRDVVRSSLLGFPVRSSETLLMIVSLLMLLWLVVSSPGVGANTLTDTWNLELIVLLYRNKTLTYLIALAGRAPEKIFSSFFHSRSSGVSK